MSLSLSEQLAQIDNFAGAEDKHRERETERASGRQTDRPTDN